MTKLKEEDIRPEELMKLQQKYFEEDIAWLNNQKQKFVEVDCPACEKKDYEPLFEKEGLDFVECNNCKTVFITPRPTTELIIEYINQSKNYKFWAEKIFPASQEARKEKIFKPML